MGKFSNSPATTTGSPHLLRTVFLTWILWLGVDFFAHAGLFVSLFQRPSLFLLPDEQFFARIPLAYAAFLLYTALTVWLVRTLGLDSPLRGAAYAAAFGSVITVAGSLALLSVSTIGFPLATVWTGVQVVEFGIAGMTGVWVARQSNIWRRAAWIGGITLLLFAGGVIVQNIA